MATIGTVIERDITRHLEAWKEKSSREVLLVRGARQVGKTFTIREFAKSFDTHLEINFLERHEYKSLFQNGSLSPETIIPRLEAYFGVSLTVGKSLLFLDEIQACPEALETLRFFHEKAPDLHVIAAGSLLEFALQELPSFGVGRVASLFMHSLSFSEFLFAIGEFKLYYYVKGNKYQPLEEIFHGKLLELYRVYSIIGGLPKVVATYITTKSLTECTRLLDSLILSYEDDFAKYKTRIDPLKIRQVFDSVAKQAGAKFVYTRATQGESTLGISQALQTLILAGIVHKIERTSANGVPLGAEVDERNFKVIPFDIGIYNRLLGTPISELVIGDIASLIHSGASAEVFCGTELIKSQDAYSRPKLYYWSRETPGSNAEVDYLISVGANIIPIEVKAGTKGQMQSLYLLMREKNYPHAVRTSAENFGAFPATPTQIEGATVQIVPVYWIGEWARSLRLAI
jgi:uncharacterized protein